MLLASSLLLTTVVADSESDRASSNSFRKRSFSSSALRHLSSRSARYFAFLSRYALWMTRGREGGSVLSFRLPLVICLASWFVWTRGQIAKFVVKLITPNLSEGSGLFHQKEIVSRIAIASHKMAAPEALTSIKTSDDKIQIINQLLLPHTTEWLSIDTIEQAHDAIKTMKVSDTSRLPSLPGFSTSTRT
jgi:hypothetical protein